MEQNNNEFAGIEFACPRCGEKLTDFSESCPSCGQDLDEQFCASFRPPPSHLVKAIAWIMLAIVALGILAALAKLLFG